MHYFLVNATCLLVNGYGSAQLLNSDFLSQKVSFYVFISDAGFLLTNVSFLRTVSGKFSYLAVLIFVYFLSFERVAVFALAKFRWSVFVSTKMSQKIVSASCDLGYWMFLEFSRSWNRQRRFFGLEMRRGPVDGSWDYFVFDFGVYFSEINLFFCVHPWSDFFWYLFSFFGTVCD